ncbi:hypothetical protein D6D10_02648 [Aureobasidium pullulans]|uniref:Uncharacterized protein n=1 Tax=Aureobasidium pullulans TaxID=5580 RepID=A0A4V4J8V0_AURPU|nr:hypothetical protein D6D25_05498 [Aureobasidium pullulans]THX41468.1 hypothetical protein D6D10_02648 [Aureobasidium pullulans]
MAPINVAHTSTSTNYDQSLQSASLELKYERSTHLVDIISKDENLRKMRFDKHKLEDDNEELRELLTQEEDRSESLEKTVNDNLARAEDAEAHAIDLQTDLQAAEQELSILRAEANALRNVTTDSEKLLTEKLDLTRQLSTLKPELDHLRAQVEANQDLLSEKLALQRQISEMQTELDHAKSEAKRAIAKRRNTQHDLNQQDEIDDLRKALTREKRLREKAQEDLEAAQAELEREKETAQRKNTTEAAKAEENASVQVETEELRRQLAKERKERERTEKTQQKIQSDWDATKAILDDKLNQFRTKLKSTKEKLKETEAQLDEAQRSAAADARSMPVATEKATKQTKKRNAAQMDPDSQKLGTPGQAKPAKKGRKAAAVGDKSTFSITPFLNRTMSIAPESPEQAQEAPAEAAAQESDSELEADSPIATHIRPSTETAPKPLATVPASKSNIKKAKPTTEPKPKKQTKKQALEQVVEEVEPTSQEEAPAATTKVPTFKAKKTADGETKPKPKQRKSLATFAAFTHEPEPEKKQKKRKLGGLGKTLFDDEDDAPSKPLPGRGSGLFGATRLGPLAAGGIRGSFIGGMGKKKSGLLTADDGFMFSPLKKERKAMASFIQ